MSVSHGKRTAAVPRGARGGGRVDISALDVHSVSLENCSTELFRLEVDPELLGQETLLQATGASERNFVKMA